MTINIKVTPATLCELCNGKFTYEACEALCDYLSDWENALYVGDICVCFAEIPAEWEDEYDEDNLIAVLNNGNVVISR